MSDLSSSSLDRLSSFRNFFFFVAYTLGQHFIDKSRQHTANEGRYDEHPYIRESSAAYINRRTEASWQGSRKCL